MAYESLIEKICGEIHNEIIRKDEEHLMTVVSQNVGYVVNREELIKALQYDRHQYEKGYADAENKYKNKWIPVGERLPEERGLYIVTEKVFSLDDREHKGRYNTMVEQVEYCNGKWQRARFFEVIAWMPLPEPYKESE